MRNADVAIPEAYTIPFALLALLVGQLELRQRPMLGSWAAYGPALVAGFGPTVIVVLMTEANPIQQTTEIGTFHKIVSYYMLLTRWLSRYS